MSKPSIFTAQSLDSLETAVALSYERTTDILTHGVIHDELGMMRFGSNYTFLVTVEHDGTSILAVYKPRSGERPLWDFPDGTLCQREVASCVLSEALGWYLVPPTVLREDGSRGVGSLQAFIVHDPERHYFTFTPDHQAQIRQMCLFDVLANNADRKGGHCLLDQAERVWGIDHGLCFNHVHKLRTVIWEFATQRIEPDYMTALQALETALYDENHPISLALSGLLEQYEMVALNHRLARLLKAGSYPKPGPGANRPWPPV